MILAAGIFGLTKIHNRLISRGYTFIESCNTRSSFYPMLFELGLASCAHSLEDLEIVITEEPTRCISSVCIILIIKLWAIARHKIHIQLRFDINSTCFLILAVNCIILVLWNCSPSLLVKFLVQGLIVWIINIYVLVGIVYSRHFNLRSMTLRIHGQTVLTGIVNLIWLLSLIWMAFLVEGRSVVLDWGFDIRVVIVLHHALRPYRNRWVSVPPKSQRQRSVFLLDFSVRFLELVFVLVVLLQRLPHKLFILVFGNLYLFLDSDKMVFKSIDFHISFCSECFHVLRIFRNPHILINITYGRDPLPKSRLSLHIYALFASCLIGADEYIHVLFGNLVRSKRVIDWRARRGVFVIWVLIIMLQSTCCLSTMSQSSLVVLVQVKMLGIVGIILVYHHFVTISLNIH